MSALAMFEIVIVAFLVNDKDKKNRFFKKSFLVVNISLNTVFEISFLTLSNANIKFWNLQFFFQIYTMAKVLLITYWIKVIN